MNEAMERNKVTVSGEIVSRFTFSHEVMGERFYEVFLSVTRTSGTEDILSVLVSDRLIDVHADCTGGLVEVTGQFRSHNRREDGKSRLVLQVFALDIRFLYDGEICRHDNDIFLDGYICKVPIYRKTPFGREISDVLLAVNRQYGKSDYIPCIAWGRNAGYVSSLPVGSHIKVHGRIQSREYTKKLSDSQYENRVAYEVSVSRIELVEDI